MILCDFYIIIVATKKIPRKRRLEYRPSSSSDVRVGRAGEREPTLDWELLFIILTRFLARAIRSQPAPDIGKV